MLRFLTAVAFASMVPNANASPLKINKARSMSLSAKLLSTSSSTTNSYDVMTKFESSDCSGTTVLALADPECLSSLYDDTCYLGDYFDASSSLLNEVPYSHYQENCATDLKTFADDAFGDQAYLRFDYYNDWDCTELSASNILIADGKCHSLISYSDSYDAIAISFKVTVNENATITYEYYYDNTGCNGTPDSLYLVTKELLSSNACDDYIKMYTNVDVNGDGEGISVSESAGGGGGLSTGAIVGIAVGCFAFVVIVVGAFLWRRKVRSDNARAEQWVQYPTTPDQGVSA